MKLRTIFSILLTGVVIFLLFLAGCQKDRFNLSKLTTTDWDPSIAVPLVNAELGPYDILAKTDTTDLIVVDPNTGLLALVYEGELFSFNADQIVQLPNQAFTESYAINSTEATNYNLPSGSFTATNSSTINYAPNAGVNIDSIVLKQGFFDLVIVQNDFNTNVGTVTLNIPGMVKNGTPFSGTIDINETAVKRFDISGYTIDMTNGGTTSNEFVVNYELYVENTNGNTATTGDRVEFSMGLNDFAFQRVFGDFGQQVVSTDQDSILIRIFKNASDGFFKLVDPKLHVDIENSFGFPVEIDFTTLESVSYQESPPVSTQITFTGSPAPFPATIQAPTFSEIGLSKSTSITVNTSNSNVDILMEPTPKYLHHKVEGLSNPSGGPSQNFITDQSRLDINTQVELPLDGYAYGWFMMDTLEFQFDEDNIEEIESILLRVIIDNGFPINTRFQLYFTDNNYTVLDSLMPKMKDIIKSGVVDTDGRVVEPTREVSDIPYDQSRVPALMNASHVIIKAEAESYDASAGGNNPAVKIYDTYKFKVKMGLKVNASLKL